MRYSIDTNALINITKSHTTTQSFIEYAANNLNDTFFVVSYVVEEFERFFGVNNPPAELETVQYNNYVRLCDYVDKLVFDDDEFIMLDDSTLSGFGILASGVSGINTIDISIERYERGGSSASYDKWRRRKVNDYLISEMSEAKYCDAIITSNSSDFVKINSTYGIKIIELEDLLIGR